MFSLWRLCGRGTLRVSRSLSIVFTCSVIWFLFGSSSALAASLFFSPSSGTYKVGETFTLRVVVSSPDQAENAVSGVLAFPSDKLDAVSISKSGSIVSLWVQEPSLGAGRGSFEGITFNPGYKGSSGRVLSVTFKAKAAGTAVVRLSSGAILANDGQGTNILSGLGISTITITDGTAAKPETPSDGTPGAVRITSPTHPDSTLWYANNDPEFRWSLPGGVNGVSMAFDTSATTNPGTASRGILNNTTYSDVNDGVSYFHLRLRNETGWGSVSHIRVAVDTTPPTNLVAKEAERLDPTDPVVPFVFSATDTASGIASYRLRFDEGEPILLAADQAGAFSTSPLGYGEHRLTLEAVDKAGNSSVPLTRTFQIEPLPLSALTYPTRVQDGETITVEGRTKPGAMITLSTQRLGEEARTFEAQAAGTGAFQFHLSRTELGGLGSYQIWAQARDSRGAMSRSSEKGVITIVAARGQALGGLSAWFRGVNPWMLVSFVLALILLIVLRRLFRITRRLSDDVGQASEAIHATFDLLHDDIEHQVHLLEKARSKRELTDEETKILKKLKKDLEVAEKYLKKKVRSIHKV